MEQGRIVEKGTHDELMAIIGRYARFFSVQAAPYLTGKGWDGVLGEGLAMELPSPVEARSQCTTR